MHKLCQLGITRSGKNTILEVLIGLETLIGRTAPPIGEIMRQATRAPIGLAQQ